MKHPGTLLDAPGDLAQYLLPAAHYKHLMAYLENREDVKLVQECANGPFVDSSVNCITSYKLQATSHKPQA